MVQFPLSGQLRNRVIGRSGEQRPIRPRLLCLLPTAHCPNRPRPSGRSLRASKRGEKLRLVQGFSLSGTPPTMVGLFYVGFQDGSISFGGS